MITLPIAVMIGIMSICKREAVASKTKETCNPHMSFGFIISISFDFSCIVLAIFTDSSSYVQNLFTEMALNAGWFRENIRDGEARWCTARPGKCCNL
jgi:hypothetical protein